MTASMTDGAMAGFLLCVLLAASWQAVKLVPDKRLRAFDQAWERHIWRAITMTVITLVVGGAWLGAVPDGVIDCMPLTAILLAWMWNIIFGFTVVSMVIAIGATFIGILMLLDWLGIGVVFEAVGSGAGATINAAATPIGAWVTCFGSCGLAIGAGIWVGTWEPAKCGAGSIVATTNAGSALHAAILHEDEVRLRSAVVGDPKAAAALDRLLAVGHDQSTANSAR